MAATSVPPGVPPRIELVTPEFVQSVRRILGDAPLARRVGRIADQSLDGSMREVMDLVIQGEVEEACERYGEPARTYCRLEGLWLDGVEQEQAAGAKQALTNS